MHVLVVKVALLRGRQQDQVTPRVKGEHVRKDIQEGVDRDLKVFLRDVVEAA